MRRVLCGVPKSPCRNVVFYRKFTLFVPHLNLVPQCLILRHILRHNDVIIDPRTCLLYGKKLNLCLRFQIQMRFPCFVLCRGCGNFGAEIPMPKCRFGSHFFVPHLNLVPQCLTFEAHFVAQ